jgi:hypothetical protein
MQAAEFVRQQFAEVRALSDGAMVGVTEEQFNWLPPGTVNPIKSVYLHMVGGEDVFLHKLLQGQPTVWAMGGWAEKIGLAQTPSRGELGWAEARAAFVALAPVLAYAEAVCMATNDYLASLTDEELDRPVSFFGRDSTVAAVLARSTMHTAGHAGEIAALKGLQGAQGLPF